MPENMPFTSTNSYDFTPNVLALGPGGINGFYELGCLQYLENKNLLKDIKYYAGCSAGAVICFLLVLGYKVYEIIQICLNFNILLDLRNLNFSEIKEKKGLISNEDLKNILEDCIMEKFGLVLTMEELYQSTGLELTFISVNVDSKKANESKTVNIDHYTYPDISSVEAVLLSSNVPFIFYQIEYKGCVYIDGAFGNPYPINVYDFPGNYTIGIYITNESADDSGKDPLTYLYKTLEATTYEMRQHNIKNCSHRCRHVPLYCTNLDSLGFLKNRDERIAMINEGYGQGIEIINNFIKGL